MQKFVLIDISNIVQRAKHGIKRGNYDSYEDLVGLILHITLYSIKNSFEKFGSTHVVSCFDGGNYWRKDLFKAYKVKEKDMSPEAIEKDAAAYQVIHELHDFLYKGSNTTVLKTIGVEADDFIARWTQHHNDPKLYHNVIVSRDSDFVQLIGDNVELYDPQENLLYNLNGVFYQDLTRAKDKIELHGEQWRRKKDKKGNDRVVEPGWSLFEKIIRGDTSDKVPSAYPYVKTVKMREAYKNKGGLLWNNLINSSFGKSPDIQQVRPRFESNKILIDLTKQPRYIKESMDIAILDQLNKPDVPLVGIQFGKLCGKNELNRILKTPTPFINILSASYGVPC
jgi:5'-3' exonuclease